MTLLVACAKDRPTISPATQPVEASEIKEPNITALNGVSYSVADKTVLESLSSITNGDDFILVKTESGDLVQVSLPEFERAYNQVKARAGKLFEKIFINGDGSVSIIEPRFLFKNKNYFFSYAYKQSYDSISSENKLGVCQHFGYKGYMFSEHTDKNYPVIGSVTLDKLGFLITTNAKSYSYKWVISSITCR